MATAKKTPAKKTPAKKAAPKVAPELVEEDGQFYIVDGNKRLDVGRSRAYAQKYFDDLYA